ncbi:MAG: formylglycine-generating enzyme family protein [Kiritimatiellae bacterium]|nr:formylglycine-generating enzyme family protein [Kiritimatiellia bacterium]
MKRNSMIRLFAILFAASVKTEPAIASVTAVQLPAGYRQLEYIQSSGVQRIKTGLTPVATDTIEMRMRVLEAGVNQCLWCSRGNGTTSATFTAFLMSSGKFRFDHGSNGEETYAVTVGNDYTVVANGSTLTTTVTNETAGTSGTGGTLSSESFTPGSEIALFASHHTGVDNNVMNYISCRLYTFKVTAADNTVKCELVPACRLDDGSIGLYDIVRDVFLTNVGTGTFRVPPATITITGVTAEQRYPWKGKVDISYTVTGDIEAEAKQRGVFTSLKVSAIDKSANTTNIATQLSGDTNLTAGTHQIVWDMAADGLDFKSSNVVFRVSCDATPALYCVIDLSGGTNAVSYPVTYLAEAPDGGFNTDEYKTTKLVLKRIEAGSFIMGDDQTNESNRVTLTKPFYMGIFEVTQKQYELATGSNPSSYKGDKRPVEKVSYNMIRVSSAGSEWPWTSAVDSTSFLGKFRARTGLEFDLPTEAQWEYACRAGTTSDYNNGGSAESDLKLLGRYSGNQSDGKGGYSRHTVVGSYQPNAWGLYDMHGNVGEWCLDRKGTLAYGTDPKGSSSGANRMLRGGSWYYGADYCASSYRSYYYPSNGHYYRGFSRGFEQSFPGVPV